MPSRMKSLLEIRSPASSPHTAPNSPRFLFKNKDQRRRSSTPISPEQQQQDGDSASDLSLSNGHGSHLPPQKKATKFCNGTSSDSHANNDCCRAPNTTAPPPKTTAKSKPGQISKTHSNGHISSLLSSCENSRAGASSTCNQHQSAQPIDSNNNNNSSAGGIVQQPQQQEACECGDPKKLKRWYSASPSWSSTSSSSSQLQTRQHHHHHQRHSSNGKMQSSAGVLCGHHGDQHHYSTHDGGASTLSLPTDNSSSLSGGLSGEPALCTALDVGGGASTGRIGCAGSSTTLSSTTTSSDCPKSLKLLSNSTIGPVETNSSTGLVDESHNPSTVESGQLTRSPVRSDSELVVGGGSSKSRQKKFHRHFPQVPADEQLLNYYSCALVADILLQGHLYVTTNYFAFYSNVFGYVTKVLIPVATVVKITKEKTAKIIPNAVGIFNNEDKHVFGSLLSRDSTYKLMFRVWKHSQYLQHCELIKNLMVELPVAKPLLRNDSSESFEETYSASLSGQDSAIERSLSPTPIVPPVEEKTVHRRKRHKSVNGVEGDISDSLSGKYSQRVYHEALGSVDQIPGKKSLTPTGSIRECLGRLGINAADEVGGCCPSIRIKDKITKNKTCKNGNSLLGRLTISYHAIVNQSRLSLPSSAVLFSVSLVILFLLLVSAVILVLRLSSLQTSLEMKAADYHGNQNWGSNSQDHLESMVEIHRRLSSDLYHVIRVRQALEALSILVGQPTENPSIPNPESRL